MMTGKRHLLLQYPRLRNFLVLGKLYLTSPHNWIPALKTQTTKSPGNRYYRYKAKRHVYFF